jgi:hypothetical protein
MTWRRLTVKGQGPEARVTFSIKVHRGKVWVSSFDCPFTCDAVLEPAQADSLVELISQAAKEARSYKKDAAS